MTPALKAVLAGCGGMSGGWIEASKAIPGLELVGFVDIQEAAAQKRAAEYGGAALTGNDLENILRETQPDIVFDCTIPEAHTSVTLTALQHGCHVLGEKPLADSMANARKNGRGGTKCREIVCRDAEPAL